MPATKSPAADTSTRLDACHTLRQGYCECGHANGGHFDGCRWNLDLLTRAKVVADSKYLDRVKSTSGQVVVMFGDDKVKTGLRQFGTVALYVTVDEGALCFITRVTPLGVDAGVDGIEAQGRALIEAAQFARTLQAVC